MKATTENKMVTLDGNEAAAHVAYRVNEICAIYPITPSSPMAEHADEWAAKGIKNIWGDVPEVVEMQSEGGAAGAVHGALQTGALTTTFTASQGLMLMLPNMYKIAGELTTAVFHVAARSLAAQALSIFGDHSDVMATRATGFGLLASASVQEAHDMALISQTASLEARVPFVHFFDGFRTSHEVSKIHLLSDQQIRDMIDDRWVFDHRKRGLNPDRPFIRGTAQNPDVYFQARETVNPFYEKTPGIVANAMQRFGDLTGRSYHLFEYTGAPDAERVIILMGSGAHTAAQTAEFLAAKGKKVGVVQVRLYRPFSIRHLLEAIPATVRKIAVLDRTKEPGAIGEPLYQDVLAAYMEDMQDGGLTAIPRIVGGRYGLSSKEFTPAMVRGIFEELNKEQPKNHFTIGIQDDVTHTSLPYDPEFELVDPTMTQALFFGLGADGTVGANKNSIKIIGGHTDLYAQGYFVYDSKKSGAKTVSHLRFGKNPIRSPYLIRRADFIACHKYNFIDKVEMLAFAKPGATFLLNSPFGADEVWAQLPRSVQAAILEKQLKFYVIDASKVAQQARMGARINTIMQTCFFALSGVLPKDEAIGYIKKAIEKTYFKKGRSVIEQNFQAVDLALSHLYEVPVPAAVTSKRELPPIVAPEAPPFVREVTAMMMEGRGDELPVSMLPEDGTYPSGTTRWEKRNIADEIPVWDAQACIQCGNCSFVCPHSVIRAKFFHSTHLEDAPEAFASAPINARGFPETRYTLQVYLEDCTSCNLCVEACPVVHPEDPKKRAINMEEKAPILERERENIEFFENLPMNDRAKIDFSLVRGAQFLEPLFEFSGACAGCGETPYVRLLTQLFGDRLIVANATGCSSIYGGNLPTTPWTTNRHGQGPAWSNSLFEDNAEFGLGMRVTVDKHTALARNLLEGLSDLLDAKLVDRILHSSQELESEIQAQRYRVGKLKTALLKMGTSEAQQLLSVADHLVRRSVWLVGGDGWAYDIGSAGLDHALASGKNINVLVLDTEVYSNTGGQMSKATPTAATAKFAAAGKRVGKKDLAMQAISYGNVYVAQIAMGANPQQTLLAMREAEAYPGPSLILAYSHCIAHGIRMDKGLDQQDLAVKSGHWPLIRYNPTLRKVGKNPFVLDSPRPSIPLKEYAYKELRYQILSRTNPEEAERLMKLAQELVNIRWQSYEDMASWTADSFTPVA
ncbi:pyruvate:ferredoxin (flavodoxin) oxidoreductase [Flavilitoribacter nigricans]|uniref:Pyruvate:ferredoxin (Flavodoxin) oxidoreductase n=1 Tax=Flavilitoribacter nigricans (strain ATCC 23147 / DSM 23189 / NBRC 102662 / NCIMB 1420 / SS-2) TaxID=1122177 RepID=A0A2D0NGB9_FLAN2|nr:pyruvate:ferredoxin (flavodoxin) oxidoreductase [Flavilitoribacter nigricans]PHN07458.1 pyruvate:ferredoxin (flavodoxin) oxidoreductase [Flavilitoribacter nigricans DSM 23189 = NBRC 102662]